MSRLDSAIRRLTAQRACLDHAAALIADLPGPVFELGLGNGRTYDHLRTRLPEREIYVFERELRAHPDCIPGDERLMLGDMRETLPRALTRFAGRVALVHADIGSGDRAASRALARALRPAIEALLAPGGIAATDQPLDAVTLERLAPPDSVPRGRYHLHRKPPMA